MRVVQTSRLLVAAVTVVALASCGDDAGDAARDASSEATSTGASASGSGQPTCGEVWVAGSELARTYRGCESEGEFVARDVLGCSSGQRMVRFDDQYYAVLGGTIHQTESSLQDDVGYRKAVASCRA